MRKCTTLFWLLSFLLIQTNLNAQTFDISLTDVKTGETNKAFDFLEVHEYNSTFNNNEKIVAFKIFTEAQPEGKAPEPMVLLEQNLPNPLKNSTAITHVVERTVNAHTIIYNLFGNLMNVLFDGNVQRGYHQYVWDSSKDGFNSPLGVYVVKLITPHKTTSQQILYIPN